MGFVVSAGAGVAVGSGRAMGVGAEQAIASIQTTLAKSRATMDFCKASPLVNRGG